MIAAEQGKKPVPHRSASWQSIDPPTTHISLTVLLSYIRLARASYSCNFIPLPFRGLSAVWLTTTTTLLYYTAILYGLAPFSRPGELACCGTIGASSFTALCFMKPVALGTLCLTLLASAFVASVLPFSQ